MSLDFIFVCDRPVYADRLMRLAADHDCRVRCLKCVEQAIDEVVHKGAHSITVFARDAKPLRPLRRLRKLGSDAPILIIADETAVWPLQHVAAWADFLGRSMVLYTPFTNREFAEAIRRISDPRFKGG